MTHRDLDPMMGRAIAADGIGTVIASAVGGSPTTTYAENIGVMAATRVHSSVAHHLARAIASAELRDDGALTAAGRPGVPTEDDGIVSAP